MIELRYAIPEDLRAVVAMNALCLAEDGTDVPLADNWVDLLAVEWAKMLAGPDAVAILAVEDAAYVGMIFCFVPSSLPYMRPYVFVGGLWVRPDKRGGKAARSLMNEAMEWARNTGATHMACSTRGKNTNRAYYRRLGFEVKSAIMVKEF